jgi:hypothetical protein
MTKELQSQAGKELPGKWARTHLVRKNGVSSNYLSRNTGGRVLLKAGLECTQRCNTSTTISRNRLNLRQ